MGEPVPLANEAAAPATVPRAGLGDSTDHPLRQQLSAEAHARPFMAVEPPARISHLALIGQDELAAHDRLARLCAAFAVPPPVAEANHFATDLGPLRLKWERHTEFATYTFFAAGGADDPFEPPAIAVVPRDWLGSHGPAVMVAAHAGFVAGEPGDPAAIARHFLGTPLVGSRVLGAGAELWSDFRTGADGYARFLVRDLGLREGQAGRLIQRVLEIETYRMMALMALPLARAAGPALAGIDAALVGLTEAMADGRTSEDERGMLDRLSRLSADIERLAAGTTYRFGAAAAYHALVEQRIAELREARIEGVPTIGEFMERRLAPAMQTCQSVAARQEALALRVSRASQILRTRVDIALEDQNRELLSSMDRRAQLQLRLQQTVEGLSVVAISYYLVGLAGYGFKALKTGGVPVDVDIATGLSVPIVLTLIWLALRRLRKRLAGKG